MTAMPKFGEEIHEEKCFIVMDCKVDYNSCPLKKTKIDDECQGCVNFRKEKFNGRVLIGKLLISEACYQRMSGEKCIRGYEKFLNNDVCKKCVRFMRNVVGETKEKEAVLE